MAKTARMVVEECMRVKSGEDVCIVTDTNLLPIAETLFNASRNVGAETVMVIMNPRQMHGNEPPRIVAQAMLGADVVLTAVTYSLTHTKARINASESGARVLIMRGVTEDMMVNGAMTADSKKLRNVTQSVRDALSKGKKVRVTSQLGTDVTFSVSGRITFVLAGFYDPEFTGVDFAVLPDGESPIAPVEGTTEGVIVFDTSVDGLGLLKEPIKLTVRKGMVEKVDGGYQAEKLKEIISIDNYAKNIAEFAIGTNPKARFIGVLAEDKKRIGSVHFALGTSLALGGTVKSKIHIDGVIKEPTVILDGKEIIRKGKLLL